TDKLRGFNPLGIFGIGNAEEEAWCSANVQLGAFRDIRFNLCRIFSAIQALLEFWNVQSQYKRMRRQLLHVECLLILEKSLVAFPIFPLLAHTLGGFGGFLSQGMDAFQWEVPKKVAHL